MYYSDMTLTWKRRWNVVDSSCCHLFLSSPPVLYQDGGWSVSVSSVAGGGTLLCSVCLSHSSVSIYPVRPQPRSASTRKKVNWFPPSRELLTFFFVLTLETLDTGHTAPHITWGGFYFSALPTWFLWRSDWRRTGDETTYRLQKFVEHEQIIVTRSHQTCNTLSTYIQYTVSTAALLNPWARSKYVAIIWTWSQ